MIDIRRLLSSAGGAKQKATGGVESFIETNRTTYAFVVTLILTAIGGALATAERAETGPDRYTPISGQNIFRLRPESKIRGHPITPEPSPIIQPSVRVTGFTDICGRGLALFEITFPGRDQTRRVLAEGDRFQGIEVLALDIRAAQATLSVEGELRVLTFSGSPESPKAGSSDLKLQRK